MVLPIQAPSVRSTQNVIFSHVTTSALRRSGGLSAFGGGTLNAGPVGTAGCATACAASCIGACFWNPFGSACEECVDTCMDHCTDY